jgi:hypothetical protein
MSTAAHGLLSDRDQLRLEAMLDPMRQQGDRGLMLVGTTLADGLGEENLFAEWLRDLGMQLRRDWPKGGDECARNWSVCLQQHRRDRMRLGLQDNFLTANWMQWIRCRAWLKLAGLNILPSRKHDGSMTSFVLDVIEGTVSS